MNGGRPILMPANSEREDRTEIAADKAGLNCFSISSNQ